MPYKDPEAKKANDRAYYLANRDKLRERSDAWKAANADHFRAMQADWYRRNRETIRERAKKAHEERPEPARTRAITQHAIRRGGTPVEHVVRSVVWDRDGGLCYLCGLLADPDNWHLDHKVPVAAGGAHSYANVAVTHPACNLKKGAK